MSDHPRAFRYGLSGRGPIQFLMGYGGGLAFAWMALSADLLVGLSSPSLIPKLVVAFAPFVLFLTLPGRPIASSIALAAAFAWAYEGWSGDPDGLGAVFLLAIPGAGYLIVLASWGFHLVYLNAEENLKENPRPGR